MMKMKLVFNIIFIAIIIVRCVCWSSTTLRTSTDSTPSCLHMKGLPISDRSKWSLLLSWWWLSVRLIVTLIRNKIRGGLSLSSSKAWYDALLLASLPFLNSLTLHDGDHHGSIYSWMLLPFPVLTEATSLWSCFDWNQFYALRQYYRCSQSPHIPLTPLLKISFIGPRWHNIFWDNLCWRWFWSETWWELWTL